MLSTGSQSIGVLFWGFDIFTFQSLNIKQSLKKLEQNEIKKV
jgi:hypothetical protein